MVLHVPSLLTRGRANRYLVPYHGGWGRVFVLFEENPCSRTRSPVCACVWSVCVCVGVGVGGSVAGVWVGMHLLVISLCVYSMDAVWAISVLHDVALQR